MIKRFFFIFILCLSFSLNAYSEDVPIKEKRIKCLHEDLSKNNARFEDYLYLLFSKNDKSVVFVQLNKNSTRVTYSEYPVRLSLYRITMGSDQILGVWKLNRETGELYEWRALKKYEYGYCSTVDKNFDPKTYLETLAAKRKQKVKEKIKF